MKAGWKSIAFEDSIERVKYTAKIQRKDFLGEGEYPVVSQEENFINGYWNDEADLFKLDRPVVVFGDHTRVLKYIDFDFVLGADGVKLLQARTFLHPKFFFYQLVGADIRHLGYARHYRMLKELKISYPSFPEQQRIVAILDEAFDGIATAKANAEKNLQNARELSGNHLESMLANHGDGWEDLPLGDLCSFENGDRGTNYPSKSARTSAGIPFINAGHLTNDGLDHESMDYISRERFDLLSNGKVRSGDILFCLRGSLGKFASVGDLNEGAIASSLVIVRPKKSVLNDFVLAYFGSSLCAGMISRFKNGAAQPNLSAQSLRNFIVPVPPISEQRSIIGALADLQRETQRLESIYRKKLAALDELKQSLLHRAFNGDL